MEPANIRFGGGAIETLLHPLVAVWMLIAAVLILTLPRKHVITPLLFTVFLVPVGQVIMVGGLHFTVLRILILVGLVRRAMSSRLSSGETLPGGFNALDRVVVLWTLSSAIVFVLEWREMQAFIAKLGELVDALGGYLVVRFLIPDGEAIRRTIKVLAVICVIQGLCMINEHISHVNVFGILGGINVGVTYRNGHIRAQGSLGNINAGVFGGVLVPLFVWLWTKGKSRAIAGAGVAGIVAMVFTCDSSTSIMAYGGSILGLGFWPLRKRMRLVRWGFALTLVALHLVMKAPVWALIARVDLTGSSSGWHRYMLVDKCIRHFNDWWLLGCKHYNDWGYLMFDMCNQFVFVAVLGGLVTLAVYIAIFSRAFAAIGTARKQVEGNRGQEWFLWCLGSTLFAHVLASFGISYQAQLLMALIPVLACISVAAFEARQTAQIVGTLDKVQFAAAPGAAGAFLPLGEAK
jgi:hypothetical protein